MWRRLPLLLSCALLGPAAYAGKAALVVGSPAPDYSGRDAVTHERVHADTQRGKVVILTFWATWCAPCRKELPILEALQRKVGKDFLRVYAVPFDEPDQTYGALVKAARSWQITLIDDRYGSIAGRYRIDSIPHLFLIDRDGRIAVEHAGFGEGSLEQLVADVNSALRNAPQAPPAPDESSGAPPAH